jgi:hypothetical protein
MDIAVVGIMPDGIHQDVGTVFIFGTCITVSPVLSFFNADHCNFMVFTPLVDNQEIIVDEFEFFQEFHDPEVIAPCILLSAARPPAYTDPMLEAGSA